MQKKLRKQIETRQTNWISWMTSAGTYDESVFNEDLDLLRAHYRNNGYLDVEINLDQVVIDTISPNKIAINIPIDEGQCYYIGDLSVADNSIFTGDELLQNITIKSGEPFSPENVDAASSSLRDYYTSRGYLEAYVRAERVPNMDSRRIDVVFRVRESEKFYVESINVEGNTKDEDSSHIARISATTWRCI